MDLIGEKGMFDPIKSPEFIKELMHASFVSDQLKEAIQVLESDCPCVTRAIRNVCIGAYILLNEKEDELYYKLREPIERNNRNIVRREREQLVALLRRVDLEKVRLNIKFGKMSLSIDDSHLTLPDPAISLTPSSAESLTSAAAELSTAPRASYSADNAPRLYDNRGRLNEPYADLLRSLGISTWITEFNLEKPIEVWGELPEAEFMEKFSAADELLSHRLIQFIRYKYSPGLKFSLDGLSSGTLFVEEDYQFSRTQVPAEFGHWQSGLGSVGLFLRMNHPRLGKNVLLLTAAHVVFSQLTNSNPKQIASFNRRLDFAHYDAGLQTDPNYTHSLDFCLLEVPSRNYFEIHNCLDNQISSLINLNPLTIQVGERIMKNGYKMSPTFGEFSSLNTSLRNRNCLVVSGIGAIPFAATGESGSVYLYEDVSRGLYFPIAIHLTSGVDEAGNTLYGGCSIVQCLQKYVQKRTGADQPPPADEIIQTFRPCHHTD